MGAVMSIIPDPRHPRHRLLAAAAEAACPVAELAHDAAHIMRVYRWCLHLAADQGADADLAGAAGLLHDLVCIAKDHPDRAQGGARSASEAGALLSAAGYLDQERDCITSAIACSSWSRGLPPTNPIAAILQDADRLDALGLTGLLRSAACHQDMARRRPADEDGGLWHPTDPLGHSQRPLDDRRWCLDHCLIKLLRLRDGMHCAAAQAEAARRHASLVAALEALEQEAMSP